MILCGFILDIIAVNRLDTLSLMVCILFAQVVSGLGREIPSPNGQAIRGAIQTDAAINAG